VRVEHVCLSRQDTSRVGVQRQKVTMSHYHTTLCVFFAITSLF
jgi:hypothetical protein